MVMCLLMPVVCLIGAAAITYVMPKKFESAVTFEIKPEADPTKQLSIPNEMAKMVTRDILLDAVHRLDFDRKWALPENAAVDAVKRSVLVSQIPGTDLVVLKTRHVNKEDARDLAAGVVMSYRDHLKASRSGGGAGPTAHRPSFGFFNPSDLTRDQYEGLVVHEAPVIAAGPASPNVPLNLALGFTAGIVTGPIVGFLLMLLFNRIWPAGRKTASPPPLQPSGPVEY